MPSRVALLFVPTLLAAATIACHPQQAPTASPDAEERDSSSASSSSTASSTTAAPTPTTAEPPPTPAEPAADADLPHSVRVDATVTVGKWPEEVAVLDDDAFVATSGSRIIRRVDLKTGRVAQSIRAGTFPVSIVSGTNEVWAVDYNSRRTLFEIDASGKPTSRGKLPDHAETLAFADGIVFALLAKNDSSVNSSVVRFDPETGKQQRSEATGSAPAGLAVGHGKVWAAADGGLVVLSPDDLAIEARIPVDARLAEVFTNKSTVYVASFSDGAFFCIDPTTREITSKADVGEPFVMAVQDDRVVTLGHSGTLMIWDPEKCGARAQLSVGQPIEGQWMTWYGSKLLVTAHGTNADEQDGVLHVLALE